MPGRVFISCGQHDPAERKVAARLKQWFKDQGYDPYVAIQAQTIQDVNSGIIGELRSADYYVFVDFAREKCTRVDGSDFYRGSLFTHQELAIAYLLGFKNCLFLQHKSVCLEGLLQYMAANPFKFTDESKVLSLVQKAIKERGWTPLYSRHLLAKRVYLPEQSYKYGRLQGRFLYGEIENRRDDTGSVNVVARLTYIVHPGGKRKRVPTHLRSHLKATGQPGHLNQIWPNDCCTFDLLVVNNTGGYLNSVLDSDSIEAVVKKPSQKPYRLDYEVFAEGFPILRFSIQLIISNQMEKTTATLLTTSWND